MLPHRERAALEWYAGGCVKPTENTVCSEKCIWRRYVDENRIDERKVRFYVFYGHLAEAKKLVDELFSPLSEENDNEDSMDWKV